MNRKIPDLTTIGICGTVFEEGLWRNKVSVDMTKSMLDTERREKEKEGREFFGANTTPTPPPAPTLLESGGTYMLIPHHLNPPPPITGNGYTPYLGYCLTLIASYKKHPIFRAFSGNLPEITATKMPLSRENRHTHAAPLCIRVGGGGGGTRLNQSVVLHQ